MRRPLLYIDTNIFLDVLWKRRGCEDSVVLFEEIKNRRYRGLTSTFTILEVHQKQQEDVYFRRQLVDYRKTFDEVRRGLSTMSLVEADIEDVSRCIDEDVWKRIIEANRVDIFHPGNETWENALQFMREFVISSSDAIHLSTAVEHGCDMLVTKDQALRDRIGDCIDSSRPRGVRSQLEDLGLL